MNIYRSASQLVGHTPLLQPVRYSQQLQLPATVLVKLEYFNPAGSVKDRVALEMIETAEKDGKLLPGGTIVEPTSGNTGIGLAAMGIARGYKVILTMPESMSVERRQMLAAYGAQLVLTRAKGGMVGAVEKAKEIALALELFTTGSLDIFGHESTVDLDKRIVVFDIHGLGEQLKPTGLLVIPDTILNRVTLNWKKGKRTHIFIDEFHVVFENEQSGIFFNSAWRQFRKRNGYPTAITQNVEYLLDSVQASTMLSNSEFVVMLNQAFSDRAKLSKLLNISDEQMSYVTNADAGCGLIKYGSALVPFINRFPKDTELYRLMTTRPGEGVFGSGNAS